MAKLKIEQNHLDKLIAYVSPSMAKNRMRDRMVMSLASGGYTGAKRNRKALSNYDPGTGDADADILTNLPLLRGRARDMSRNAPIGAGAINTNINYVVGTGLSMQPRINYEVLGLTEEQADKWQSQVQLEWEMFAESTDCDATLSQNFYELQALAFRSVLESGDVLAVLAQVKRNKPYNLAIQMIEADRLCNPSGKMDTQEFAQGIEFDQYGAPTRYHISKKHPGAFGTRAMQPNEWVAIDAFGKTTGRRNVLHLFEKKRPGQIRGVPYLAPVIEQLKQLERYTEAELQAAVIAASFAVFMTMDAEGFHELFENSPDGRKAYLEGASNWDGSIPQADLGGAGKVVNLLPGETPVTSDFGRPNDKFDPFVQAIFREVGVSLELPYEILIKHFTASYSAARAALLDAWRLFRRRRDWLAMNFCQPVYQAWLEEGIATGRINAPGFFADPLLRHAWSKAEWIGDGPGSIDPEKEVKAAKLRNELGITTLEHESVLYDGVPWKQKHRQQVKEKKLRDEAGFVDANPAQPSAEPTPADNNGSDLET